MKRSLQQIHSQSNSKLHCCLFRILFQSTRSLKTRLMADHLSLCFYRGVVGHLPYTPTIVHLQLSLCQVRSLVYTDWWKCPILMKASLWWRVGAVIYYPFLKIAIKIWTHFGSLQRYIKIYSRQVVFFQNSR